MKRGKNLIGLGVAVILGLSLILIPIASLVSPVQAAVSWTKYSGEVTLDSELYVVDAWVIKESSTSYKMWYTYGKKDLTISAIINVVTDLDLDDLVDDIASQDLELFLDDLGNLAADVSDIADLFGGIGTVIGYATSTDGKNWEVEDENREVLAGSSSALWESVGAPCVIKNSDSSYEMWYTRATTSLTRTDLEGILDDIGTGDRNAAILDLLNSIGTVVGYATSTNGWDWEASAHPQVLPASSDVGIWGSVADPCVIKTDSSYEMWYTRAKTDITQTYLNDDILTNIGDFDIADFVDILDGTAAVIGYATSTNGWDWDASAHPQVLPVSSDIGAWSSVANPSVVKNSATDYEMWYTNIETDLVEANIHTLASEIGELNIGALWDTLTDDGITEFIDALVALHIDDIKSVLSGTSTVIGYATSSDGANWTVQNSQHLTGSSNGPWSGVAAPSVVRTSSDDYEMWYTEGFSDLSWQNLLDLILGDNLPIGYAYYTPSEPSGPSPPPAPTIETELFGIEGSFPISDEGVIEEEIVATSEDGNVTVTIEAGTIALLEGEPLETLEAAVDPSPPEPPEDAYLIGAYDFGPDGATFDPPITLTWSYDPETLPEGMDLVIAYYDEVAGEWVWVPCEVDTENNIITASVAHFTTFAIIAVPAVALPEEEEVAPPEEEVAPPEEEVAPPEEEVAPPEEEVAEPEEEVAPPVVPPVVPKAPIAWWIWLIIGLVSAAVVGFAVRMVVSRRRD